MKRDDAILLVDHLYAIHEAFKESYLPRMPSNAQVHFRTMKKEALLGARSLLDAVIDNLGSADEGKDAYTQQTKANQSSQRNQCNRGKASQEGGYYQRSSSASIEITD
ncbi:hypothetical protein [Paenibacillus arenosi]|uniref:Uncharacterized protein n=1 Tax=Paenibacillus arenosi TaxID=2774142 RepID=A0ABR9AYG8_9BACL|nr:hypothetical protein [Paenibacillus arenosi]MBD8499195.1 hypothetical protein [Paenibacillus arenosi]